MASHSSLRLQQRKGESGDRRDGCCFPLMALSRGVAGSDVLHSHTVYIHTGLSQFVVSLGSCFLRGSTAPN